jgi:CheY-like chemotaxis protein
MLTTAFERPTTGTRQDPLAFLHGTLPVLVVDDNPAAADCLCSALLEIPIYTVLRSTSCREAGRILNSGMFVPVVTLDMGMTDVNDDEYYLLRRFSQNCAFIVLSGTDDPEKGFLCAQLGAKEFVRKPHSLADVRVRIGFRALEAALSRHFRGRASEQFYLALRALFDHFPEDVDDWSARAGISSSDYLRQVWNASGGPSPKTSLHFFQVYRSALAHYEQIAMEASPAFRTLPIMSDEFGRCREYFLTHRSALDAILK